MIKLCKCGGLYSDNPPESYAGKPCICGVRDNPPLLMSQGTDSQRAPTPIKMTPEELEKIRNNYHLYVIHCSGNDPAANDVAKCLHHISALEAENGELKKNDLKQLSAMTGHSIEHLTASLQMLTRAEMAERERDQLKAENLELRKPIDLHAVVQRMKAENDQLRAQVAETAYLLRQLLYSRCPLGTKLIDELDKWKMDDLEQRMVEASDTHGQYASITPNQTILEWIGPVIEYLKGSYSIITSDCVCASCKTHREQLSRLTTIKEKLEKGN